MRALTVSNDDPLVVDESVLNKLKLVSTPTLATALYKRGLRKPNEASERVLSATQPPHSMLDHADIHGLLYRSAVIRLCACRALNTRVEE